MASSKRARSVVIKTFQRDNYCSQIINHQRNTWPFSNWLFAICEPRTIWTWSSFYYFFPYETICDACTLSTDLRLAMSPLGNYHIYLYTDQVTFTLRRSRCYSGGNTYQVCCLHRCLCCPGFPHRPYRLCHISVLKLVQSHKNPNLRYSMYWTILNHFELFKSWNKFNFMKIKTWGSQYIEQFWNRKL